MNGDEYSYIHGRSTAGFIYTVGGQQRIFHTTDEPNRRKMDFPPQCIACSSEMGLVLFYRLTNACSDSNADADADTLYHVSNPSYTGYERSIPNPPRSHPNPTPRILIVGWDPTRVCLVFHIVCAVEEANPASYSFDVYSSFTDKWEPQGSSIINLGQRIRANTGVSCGTRAYWLLDDSSVPTIAYYDVHRGVIGTIDPPKECSQCPTKFPPQLGRWGCELCLVVILDKSKTTIVFTLGQHGRWLRHYDRPYSSACPPKLSRFQSAKLEVPFWCELLNENWLVLLKNSWRERTNFGNHSWLKLDSPEPDFTDLVLPHVATDLLPLIHFPFMP